MNGNEDLFAIYYENKERLRYNLARNEAYE